MRIISTAIVLKCNFLTTITIVVHIVTDKSDNTIASLESNQTKNTTIYLK